jgi:hypothetical protein
VGDRRKTLSSHKVSARDRSNHKVHGSGRCRWRESLVGLSCHTTQRDGLLILGSCGLYETASKWPQEIGISQLSDSMLPKELNRV